MVPVGASLVSDSTPHPPSEASGTFVNVDFLVFYLGEGEVPRDDMRIERADGSHERQ